MVIEYSLISSQGCPMPVLPYVIMTVIGAFAPLFSKRVFEHAKLLLAGAILAPGKRTVTAALRVMGKSDDRHFQNYHRVLNRAHWSSLKASRILLSLLIDTFVPEGPLVMGIDETIERRRGEQISAKGIYRDPVRSSHTHFVKASGLRWVSLMMLVRIPWAARVWALPFLTVLAPSERYYQARGRRPQSLLDRAHHAVRLVRRWQPARELVVVGDHTYAALEWLAAVRKAMCVITRLRLDAALYEPAPPRKPKQNGRPRKKGARLPTLAQVMADASTPWQTVTVPQWYGQGERRVQMTSATAVWYHTGLPPVPIRWVLIRDPSGRFAPQAWLSTKLDCDPVQILKWFVQRWQLETTFEEARAHIGIESCRQWNDRSVARTTPALFGLYSIVTLIAAQLIGNQQAPVRMAAWYPKQRPTFSDTIALVRRSLWNADHCAISGTRLEIVKIPRSLFDRVTDALCYAA
jgi:DDE superfamily endonuclease